MEEATSTFRQWKNPSNWQQRLESEHLETIWQDIQRRMIRTKHGTNIIGWGYGTTGTFMVKEDYSLLTTKQKELPLLNWRKIWNPNFWPKVSTFLWLLYHRHILTWDNLLKWYFQGAS